MALAYRDDLSGGRRRLGAAGGGRVGLYVCGPTVYAPAHVGHGRTYLTFDVLRRHLLASGNRVRYVMNLTDVEEKIDRRAAELRIAPLALARREEGRFFRDMDALGVLRPSEAPRASEWVDRMVLLARRLERASTLERRGDGWWFHPPPGHARRNFALGRELARHAVRERRPDGRADGVDPREFLVWKRQEGNGPSWASPWGRGVPGWHLECYTMAEHYLGIPVGLQGGGKDLIFPHHYAQNEIALTLTGQPFARGFLHTEFVRSDGRKMSKSVGNLVGLGVATRAHGAGGLRWYLLGHRFNEPLDWDARAARRASDEYGRVRHRIATSMRGGGHGALRAREVKALSGAVERSIADGLCIDRAFERIRAFVRRLERMSDPRPAIGERAGAVRALREIEGRTGLDLGVSERTPTR